MQISTKSKIIGVKSRKHSMSISETWLSSGKGVDFELNGYELCYMNRKNKIISKSASVLFIIGDVFNKFHADLLVAQFAGAKLAQVNGIDYPLHSTPKANQL